MKKILFLFILIIISSPTWGKVNVITTTSDLAALVTEIGVNKVSVTILTKGTRDPHYAQAKPSMIRKLFRADLLVVIGAEMEVGWLPALLRSSRNSKVFAGQAGHLDVSESIALKGKPSARVTRDMGDVHAAGNPHYWLDPDNGILMAKAITERLSKLDSGNAKFYQNNFDQFKKKMKKKILEWKTGLQSYNGKNIIAYHTSLLYFADAFDFDIRGYVEPKPGLSPSASHLNQLIKTIKTENIRYLLMEPYYETRSAELLKRKSKINYVVIPQSVGAKPDIKTYFGLFDDIVSTLKAVDK